MATTAFMPLEAYELVEHATVLKGCALVVNLVAVGYLVFKGRLFGIRGGHGAHLVELREATLRADILRSTGSDTSGLTSHRLV